MIIAYESMTGNVIRFLSKMGNKCKLVNIKEVKHVHEPFVLVTHTIFFGQVPEQTALFVEKNKEHFKGVASSGDRNWGEKFAIAADTLANAYNVPVLLKFQKSGTEEDVLEFKKGLASINNETY